jgi:hypothetical protein
LRRCFVRGPQSPRPGSGFALVDWSGAEGRTGSDGTDVMTNEPAPPSSFVPTSRIFRFLFLFFPRKEERVETSANLFAETKQKRICRFAKFVRRFLPFRERFRCEFLASRLFFIASCFIAVLFRGRSIQMSIIQV